jgi:Magnesium transporter NIPA
LNIQKFVHNTIKIPSVNIHLEDRERQPQAAMNENSYFRKPLWWVGMFVLLLGELGNFSAYGFAPAGIAI